MEKNWTIPFLEDIHKFNVTFHKPENSEPTIPENYQFILDTIQEEKDELEAAFKAGDIVEVADALADLLYFVGNGVLATGLTDKFREVWDEVQASNMSKVCPTEDDAKYSVEYMESRKGVPYYYKEWKDEEGKPYWIVYRKSDNKAGKNWKWFTPNIKQILEK